MKGRGRGAVEGSKKTEARRSRKWEKGLSETERKTERMRPEEISKYINSSISS